MDIFLKNLESLGLNQREITVYTTLTVFGKLSITKLAGRSRLPRTTVDAIVRRLAERGFVKKVRVGKRFLWEAQDLTKLKSKTNVAFEAIQSQIDPHFAGPVIESIDAGTVGIRVFHGKHQIQEAYRSNIVRPMHKIQIIDGSAFVKHYSDNLYDRTKEISYMEAIRDKELFVEGIIPESQVEVFHKIDSDHLQVVSERLMVVHTVPDQLVQFSLQICILDDMVVILNPEEYNVILIKNKGIVASYASYFDTLMLQSRRFNHQELITKILQKREEKQEKQIGE